MAPSSDRSNRRRGGTMEAGRDRDTRRRSGGWRLMLAASVGCSLLGAGPALGESLRRPTSAVGLASWYGAAHEGRPTASGRPFRMRELTAAHPTLPAGTRLLVTNLANGRKVVVEVSD